MLIDTTLREGEQAHGVYFDPAAKARILGELAASGVEELEIGCAGQEDLPGLMDAARRCVPGCALGLWAPLREQGLGRVLALGPDVLNLGVPVSDAHLGLRLGLDRAGLLERVRRVAGRAVDAGAALVSVGLEDVTRADPDFALDVALAAVQAGARRVRLADTVGRAAPLDMAALARRFKDAGVPCLAVHCHNDFGMATANAVTALACGADAADVSVLGLGERAGIAPLEEVAASQVLRGGGGSYDLRRIRDLCLLVARMLGRPLAPDRPVTGAGIFAVESGLHVHGLVRSPDLFEPFPAEAVGGRRVLSLGKKSGRGAVAWALDCLGLACGPEALPDLVRRVRAASARQGRPLGRGEFLRLAQAGPGDPAARPLRGPGDNDLCLT